MSSEAEKVLQKTTYHGKQRCWNFERFIKVQVDAHAILEGLVEHGYSGIDEQSKVRHLIDGIKTNKLEAVKAQIFASAALRQDYPACVTLFKDFIKQTNMSSNVRDAGISAVNSSKDDRTTWDNVDPDMSVEDRYYKPQEYASLSAAKKAGLLIKRKKRGKKGGKAPKKKGANNPPKPKKNQSVNLSKSTIKAIATAVHEDDDGSDEGSSSEEEIPMNPPAKKAKLSKNRDNPALKCH